MKPAWSTLLLSAFLGLACTGGPSTPLRVFVTSGLFFGDLGGLAGADAKCQTAADGGALGGQWVAWLSDSSTTALRRLSAAGPWYLVDESTKVFNNRANLETSPIVAIDHDEHGRTVSAAFFVWTGSPAGGGASSQNCSDWTQRNMTFPTIGDLRKTDEWTEVVGSSRIRCNGELYIAGDTGVTEKGRLYCLQNE